MWEDLKKVAINPEVIACLLKEDSNSITGAWINLILESPIPVYMDSFVSIWETLPEQTKKSTYKDAEFLLMQVLVERDGQWPPKTIPDSFINMQTLCITYEDNPLSKSHYAESVGRAYVDNGNPQKAIEFLKYAESLLNTQNEKENIIKQYCDVRTWLSMAYLSNKEYDLALKYANSSLDACENVYRNEQNLQHVHFVIGRILYNRNQFQEAVIHLEKSFDIAEKHDSDEVAMSICNGIVQGYISMFTLASENDSFKDLLNDENHAKYLYYLEKNAHLYHNNGFRKEAKQMFEAIAAMKE